MARSLHPLIMMKAMEIGKREERGGRRKEGGRN